MCAGSAKRRATFPCPSECKSTDAGQVTWPALRGISSKSLDDVAPCTRGRRRSVTSQAPGAVPTLPPGLVERLSYLGQPRELCVSELEDGIIVQLRIAIWKDFEYSAASALRSLDPGQL